MSVSHEEDDHQQILQQLRDPSQVNIIPIMIKARMFIQSTVTSAVENAVSAVDACESKSVEDEQVTFARQKLLELKNVIKQLDLIGDEFARIDVSSSSHSHFKISEESEFYKSVKGTSTWSHVYLSDSFPNTNKFNIETASYSRKIQRLYTRLECRFEDIVDSILESKAKPSPPHVL
jgi:hypothetical protein